MTAETTYPFRAEIQQLLHILVHSLYKDRDIFLRELISNASDALSRLQFEMLTSREVLEPDRELAIHLEIQTEGDSKTVIIRDSGVGMTAEELVANLGVIAQSGARQFLTRLRDHPQEPPDIIGRFGVGFYSVFMVAQEVRVISRSYRLDAEPAAWVSSGDDTFRIEPANKSDRGTEVHIRLREDAAEYAEAWKLKRVVKQHSDYIGFPIYLDGEQINQRESLWRKNPSDVSDEAYPTFYQQMTLDFEPPLTHIHFVSDAPVQVRCLLFIPARAERSVLSVRKEPGLKLYANNVLIQEYCKDLLPEWLGFIDGVVDSEALPLNVSRETVQNNRLMKQLERVVRKRVLRTLNHLAEQDQPKYATFWQTFGRVLKEGLVVDPTAGEDIQPLLRFTSSHSQGEWVSLAAYVERMPAAQEAIYYVLADSEQAAAHSPHLDPFRARSWEVLYLVEPIDAFVATTLREYKGKPWRNVDEAGLTLPELEEETESPAAEPLTEEALQTLLARCAATLGERVTEVRISKVLRDNPVRLAVPDNHTQAGMERLQRYMRRDYEAPPRVLEINRTHPIVVNLTRQLARDSAAPIIDLTIEQLYESALLQEGLHPNPSLMLPRIQQLLELASAHFD